MDTLGFAVWRERLHVTSNDITFQQCFLNVYYFIPYQPTQMHYDFVYLRCIIAMGLDKKPTPPVKRVKEEPGACKSPDEATDVDEDIKTHSKTELRASQEMETDHNGVTAEQKKRKDGMN